MLHTTSIACTCTGGPSAPVPVLRMVNSGLIILDWEAPFTWPYTDIHHYSVSVNTSMENWNQTDSSLEFRPTQEHIECTVYAFTVLANNRLADGIPGTVIGGFPIGNYIVALSLKSLAQLWIGL